MAKVNIHKSNQHSAMKNKPLSGWGRVATSHCELLQPSNAQITADAVISSGNRGVIGRGCGRSYGDVSTNAEGRVVDMTTMDAVEHFNDDTAQIVCESGVTMRQLVTSYLPRGFVPPVCPGTGYVTVGGAVAHDVHGKNHYKHGSFGDHVDWLDLLLPSGEIRRVSMNTSQDLFFGTIGGAGLTGIIIRVAFTMLRINTNAVSVHERRIVNLDQLMEALAVADRTNTYSVAWIDAIAKGTKLGRGILITAEPAEGFKPIKKRTSINIPFNFPSWTLNRFSVSLFNMLYLNRFGDERDSQVDFERFVFPLDALLNWNRLYGSRGVYQFQCVIPHDHATFAMRELLELSANTGAASPLAVMKTLSGNGRGFLSFPMPGFTLALDFPKTTGSINLIRKMHEITLRHSGRIYLAKDMCLAPDQLRLMYPQLNRFEELLHEIDPMCRMQSDMSRRLRLHTIPGGGA